MIIGNGDIASVLNDREGALFFASGVSNSRCEDNEEFTRERVMLEQQDRSLCCFYFSSISIFTGNSPYIWHKAEMEALVERTFLNFNIIRIGNISWGSNPNTFINYIHDRQRRGEPVEISDEYRFVIEESQLTLITDSLPLEGRNIINVFGKMGKVKDLL